MTGGGAAVPASIAFVMTSALAGYAPDPYAAFRGKGNEEMRTRNRAVQVYLNEKEYEKLEQLSRFSGNSHSAVIRKLITGKEIRQRPDLNFRALAMEISAIGNNLNQIARRANQMQVTTADLKEAKLLMREINDRMKAAGGDWA